MATQLDLQEQEQVDALKAFWKRYGNLITWTLTLALAAFAGWNFWLSRERDQALEASTLYGELETAMQAGDVERTARIFADMKTRTPRATYTQHAGLLAAQVQQEKGQSANALASLRWVAEHGNEENAAVARFRWAGLLADQKKYAEARQQLDLVKAPSFSALAADRRGDIFLAEGQREPAKAAYRVAWAGMPATSQYRFLVEAKLGALGAAPGTASDGASAASSASAATAAASGAAQ